MGSIQCIGPRRDRILGTRGAILINRDVSMDDHPNDPANDQTEQQLLIFLVSEEELEKAAGATTGAQTYPSTCVATICISRQPVSKLWSP